MRRSPRSAGHARADRVEITWADGAIKNQWLEVQVLPTSRTGLTATDVFFWGSKVGDLGSPAPTTFTTPAAGDAAPIIFGGLGPAGGITDPRDYDRSNTITAAGDRTAALTNIGAITRINIGSGGPFAPEGGGERVATGDAGIASGVATSPSVSSWPSRTLPTSTARRLTTTESAARHVSAAFEQWADPGLDDDDYDDGDFEELFESLAREHEANLSKP